MRSEFELIDHLKKTHGLRHVGDDCAVLPMDASTDLVLTTDMLVENVDFRLNWATPESIGHKALAVSLSDIAAMGATPVWAMVSIAIPEDNWRAKFIERFYAGWHLLAAEAGVELVGGDISRSPEGVVIDSIAGGQVRKGVAIRRSGAKPGDGIFVSGTLGGAAGGLELIESGAKDDENNDKNVNRLLARQLRPQPQVILGKQLQQLTICTSMIDISDGLSSDLNHICVESGVGAQIVAESLPVDNSLLAQFTPDRAFEMALHGGEDLELLFTADEKKISGAKIMGISRIGTVTANVGIIELTSDGITTRLEPKGYRHF